MKRVNFLFQHHRFLPQSTSQKHGEAFIIAVLFKLGKRKKHLHLPHVAPSHIQQLDFSALPSHRSNPSEAKPVFLGAEFIPIVWHLLRAKMVCADNRCNSAEPQQLVTPRVTPPGA